MRFEKLSGFLLFAALFYNLNVQSISAQIYVNGTFGNDSSFGSSTAPLKTIAKALSIVSPGGTIVVYGGVYNEAEITITKPVNFEAASYDGISIAKIINGITIYTPNNNDTVKFGLKGDKFELGKSNKALVLKRGILDIITSNVIVSDSTTIERQSSSAVLLKSPTFGTHLNLVYSTNLSSIIAGKELPDTVNNFTLNLPDSGSVILTKDLTVKGTLLFDGGSLDLCGYNLYLHGDINETIRGGFFVSTSSSNLYFTGNKDQVISLNTNKIIPHNLNIFIQKTIASNTITLSGDNSSLDFNADYNSLNFVNGLLITGSNTVRLDPGIIGGLFQNGQGFDRSYVTGSNLSHIVGNVVKKITSAGTYTFPVGSLKGYREATFTFIKSPENSFDITVYYKDEDPLGNKGFPIEDGSCYIDLDYSKYFWLIKPSISIGETTKFGLELLGNCNFYYFAENYRVIKRIDGDVEVNNWSQLNAPSFDYANYNLVDGGDTLTVVRAFYAQGPISSVGERFTLGLASCDFPIQQGTVKYDNTVGTPLPGVTVNATPSAGGAALTATTDAQGGYTFANIPAGQYTVSATSSAAWLPCTAVDALLIAKHYAGTDTLKGLKLVAADVNASNSVNNTDALLVLKRTTNSSVVFAKGNWVFTNANVTVTNANVTADLKGLSTGDVNADGMGTTAKATVQVSNNSKLSLSKKNAINLPVKVGADMNVGAMTLTFKYPADLVSYEGIASKADNIQVNDDQKGNVVLAWADLSGKTGIDLKAGDALVTLQFKSKNELKAGNKIDVELNGQASELANSLGEVLAGATLDVASLEVAKPTQFTLSNNYPNPFNPTTTIRYELPVNARVNLVVYNTLGEQVATLVNGQQEVGQYEVNFNASNLTSGVYFYKLTANFGNRNFTQTRKLMLIK